MKPLADFSCLSKKCLTPDGAPVYELPVDSTRCPVCGSKRIQRLFNKVGVIGLRASAPDPDWRLTSSSTLERSKALLQDGADAAYSRKASAQEMPTYEVGSSEREVSTRQGKFIMPSRTEVVQHFRLGGKASAMTQMEVAREVRQDRLSVPAVLHRLNRLGIPTIEHRDARG